MGQAGDCGRKKPRFRVRLGSRVPMVKAHHSGHEAAKRRWREEEG